MITALPVQVDESILEIRNNIFLSILGDVAKQFGLNYEPEQLASFALTSDDIAQLSNNAQQLTADISNKADRIKQFGLATNQDGLIAQLYWKKHSLFMSELISRLAKAEPLSPTSDQAEKFYLNLGYSRHLIGLFTEQIRKPEIKILENGLDEIKKSYFQDPYWSKSLEGYKQYGRLRGVGRQIRYVNLFEQSSERDVELVECVAENAPPWEPIVFQQLNTKLEQQKQIVKNYPYSISVNNVVFHSNKPLENIAPQVFSKLTDAIRLVLYPTEKCNDAILDVQQSGECYVETIINRGTLIQHNKYYFPNQFMTTNEGKGFYLGNILEFNSSTDKRIDCHHCAMYKNMQTLLASHYNTVVKSLDKPTDTFLSVLGEYCFLFINVMPYVRGSAAIGEWMMRGLAKAHGIELGAFSEGLSWDFSAFLSISAEKYAEEYKRYFQQITPYLMTSKNELMLKVLCDDISKHASQDPSMSKELLSRLSTLNSLDDVHKTMSYIHKKANEVVRSNRPHRFFRDSKNNDVFYERAYELLDLVAHDLAPIALPKKEKITPKSGCC